MFIEITGEKLAGRAFPPPPHLPILNRVKEFDAKLKDKVFPIFKEYWEYC